MEMDLKPSRVAFSHADLRRVCSKIFVLLEPMVRSYPCNWEQGLSRRESEMSRRHSQGQRTWKDLDSEMVRKISLFFLSWPCSLEPIL